MLMYLSSIHQRHERRAPLLLRVAFEAFTRSSLRYWLCAGAALFFDLLKDEKLDGQGEGRGGESVHHHMVAASAEMFACLVRVPTENVKQNCRPAYFHQLAKQSGLWKETFYFLCRLWHDDYA